MLYGCKHNIKNIMLLFYTYFHRHRLARNYFVSTFSVSPVLLTEAGRNPWKTRGKLWKLWTLSLFLFCDKGEELKFRVFSGQHFNKIKCFSAFMHNKRRKMKNFEWNGKNVQIKIKKKVEKKSGGKHKKGSVEKSEDSFSYCFIH